MIKRRKHLAMKLESIPSHINPSVNLEQYSTPADIASDVLWNAYSMGDIEGKVVCDLGCGTGIFTIGSALLGSKKSIGVDIDLESLNVASYSADLLNINNNISFINDDVENISCNVNTVFQNPPFGAQGASIKNADRLFMRKSLEIADTVYSFHLFKTYDFVKNYFNDLGGKITGMLKYDFPLPKQFEFHTKESINIKVIVVKVEKI
ncbi:MAG: METTL5 family protein [Methanobacteriaceae archaeon]|nr:METTL5 family protein [Methanobacteriaceae archaeon]